MYIVDGHINFILVVDIIYLNLNDIILYNKFNYIKTNI